MSVEGSLASAVEAGAGMLPNTSHGRFTDELLDDMRRRGDPPADRVIQALFEQHELGEARRLLATLVFNEVPAPQDLPAEVRDYLSSTSAVDAAQMESIEQGQELFAEHGPLILMCLAHYSLPAAYAAAKGVEVLHRTAYLERRPAKRLFETTQMVIDVMTPGGLTPSGRGVRTAQKVRLMHAMVRHLLQNDPDKPWDPALGVPINQEDLAGTLMTFSWVILDGLSKLGVHVTPQEQSEYLAAWRAVGRLMGVEEVLIPSTVFEARQLTQKIQGRQIAQSEAGRLLTRALLEMMQRASDLPCIRNMSGALMRHFLPRHVADFLGVPQHALDGLCVEVVRALAEGSDHVTEDVPALGVAARHFSLHFVQWMTNVELGGRSAPFVISDGLRKRWDFTPQTEPSFWHQLLAWLGKRWNNIL